MDCCGGSWTDTMKPAFMLCNSVLLRLKIVIIEVHKGIQYINHIYGSEVIISFDE